MFHLENLSLLSDLEDIWILKSAITPNLRDILF